MAFIWIVVLAVFGLALAYADGDPCSNRTHIVLADNPYRSTSYSQDDDPNCDYGYFVNGTWYRFGTDGLWDTMPEECVQNGFCDTEVPIWLDGTHPTEADPGPKAIPVCGKYPWEESCCGWTGSIQVKWCSDNKGPFYVYQLKPVDGCDMAYCAGQKEPCPVGKRFIKETETCQEAFPVQTEPPTLSEPLYYDASSDSDAFYFQCTVHYDCSTDISSQARFQVKFVVNDEINWDVSIMDVADVSCEDLPVKLDYLMLKTHVGKQLRCAAQSYWSQDESPRFGSPVRHSSTFWLGIESDPAAVDITITVSENPAREIIMTPTIPLGCDCCTGWKVDNCKLTISYITKPELAGQQDKQTCDFVLDNDNRQTSIKIRTNTMTEMAKHDGSYQIDFVTEWSLYNQDSIFHGYAPAPLTVHVFDTKRPVCSSTGDPHILTFDGKWLHVYKNLEYYLVKRVVGNDTRVFQVQVHHYYEGEDKDEDEGRSRFSRNCAVAVRENDNILGINNCDPQHKALLFRHAYGTGGFIKINGNVYTIIMPSGSKVEVHVDKSSRYIEVYVTAIKEDWGKLDGLCGNFDSNSTNDVDEDLPDDLRPNDANNGHDYTDKFIVPNDESLFNPNNSFECNYLGEYPSACRCDQTTNEIICGPPGQDDPDDGSELTKVSPKPPKGVRLSCVTTTERTKRSVDIDDYSDDIDELVYIPPDNSREFTFVEPSWPTTGGITEEEAEMACSGGLAKSPALEQCKALVDWERLVEQCVMDVKYMDMLDPAKDIASILDTLCTHAAEVSVEYMNGEPVNPEALVVATAIQQAVCPNQCSDHGQCQNGACVCDSGYSASDCSVDVVSPPTIEALILGGLCDVQKRPCRSVRISASNINYSAQIKCKLQYTGLNSIGAEETMETVVDAQEASSFQLKCPLPEHWVTRIPHSSGFDMPWTKMMISISNDGSAFSMTQSLFIHDSVCITCDEETCTQKPNSCLINGRCYASGHLSDGCKTCDPVLDTLEWTQLDAAQCEIAKERTTTSSTTTRTINGSRRTTTAPQRPSPIWGPWSNCSRDCDYGEMKRQCQSECFENSENKVCWMQRCPERPEQVNRGVFIDVDQEAVMVAASSLSLRESVASAINTRCAGEDPGVCCRALGKTASLSVDLLNQRELVTVDNVKISNGFPHRVDNGKTRVSLYVAVPKTLVDLVCVEESDGMVKRAAGDDDTVVYFDKEILYTIIDDNTDSIKQSSGLAISSTYLGPGATGPQEGWTWQLWMTVVIACCGGLVLLVVIIVVAFCIHRQKKKRGNPEEKEKRYVANDYENVKHPSASYLQTTNSDVNNKMDGCYTYVDQNMGNNPQNECAEHVYEEMNNDKIVNEKRPGSASSTSSKLAWM